MYLLIYYLYYLWIIRLIIINYFLVVDSYMARYEACAWDDRRTKLKNFCMVIDCKID